MKKILKIYIILSIFLFVLCGCNDSKNNTVFTPEKMSTETSSPKEEIQISEFTTKILDQTPNRVNNISVACKKLNEVVVKSNEIFSFNDTLGEVNESTGYKKADVLDYKR